MNYLSIRFLLPKYEINQIIFSPVNVKITIRGRGLNPSGWLHDLKELKRIEKIVSGVYEKYVVSISSDRRDQLHELGTEQSIAKMIFDAAYSFGTEDDQFEIFAVDVEGFGLHGQYDCRYCPFEMMVDNLVHTSFKNGIAPDVGEQIIEAAKVSHQEVFGFPLEPEAADLMRKMIKGDQPPPFVSGGFCNIDPRDEMDSAEYQAMMRKETTGSFQAQKHAAFNPDESRRLAFDRDHEDHLLQLNAEDSILFVDVSPNLDRIRLISYFVGLDELYIIEQFTDATKDKFSFETIARAAIINIKRRIEENRVADQTVWIDPFAAPQLFQMLQHEGIRVHELRRINPISEKIKTALRLMEHKAAAKRAPDPHDRSCDFCFYPLQNKEIVSSDQIFDSLFCSRECLNHYANKHGIELRRVGDPILSNDDRPDPRIRFEDQMRPDLQQTPPKCLKCGNGVDPRFSIKTDQGLLCRTCAIKFDFGQKTPEPEKVKSFSPEALEKSDFCDITKHLLSTVEENAPPRQTIHIIAPDSKGCAALIQSLLLSIPFGVDIFVHEFNDSTLPEQHSALLKINAEFEAKHGLHGVSEPVFISEQFLKELSERDQKMLAVYDPGNLGLNHIIARDYFGQMAFDIFATSPDFSPRVIEHRNKSPESNDHLSPDTIAIKLQNEAIKKNDQSLKENAAPSNNAADLVFVGDVDEFVKEETQRLENVPVSPNVENSTMAETPRDEVIEVASSPEIYQAIIESAACPICKAQKKESCVSFLAGDQPLRTELPFSVHSARIAACDKSRGEQFKKDFPALIPGESLLKPAVVVEPKLQKQSKELIKKVVDSVSCPVCPAPRGGFCFDVGEKVYEDQVHPSRMKLYDETNAPAKLYLDIDFERARAIHRIVRGFHDGECPNCNQLFDSRSMLDQNERARCPKCGFSISYEEKQAAIKTFAPVMKKNLEIFESWRTEFIKSNNPDLFNAPDPETFKAIINAVACPVCGAREAFECESHEPQTIFSPMAASVHNLRKSAFDVFILTSKGEYAPIKILDESPRQTMIEKVSCPVPFCEAGSNEPCVYSRDQRPEGSSIIEIGIHEARFQYYKDL